MSKLAMLKKNRVENMKKLQEKLQEQSGGGYQRDERIWKPKFNKDKGKGTCIVRFLTPKEGDPFVEVKHYQFKDKGGYFWENALQTINEKDPIQLAAISAFRKAKNEDDTRLREYAKRFLPKSTFYANIYVIKDEEVPENEGKVFIYQFGRQIFQMIEKAIQPEFDDEEPMDPFDFWSGADFKIRMVGKKIPDSQTGNLVMVPNYEESTFDKVSEFMDGDEDKIEEFYNQTHDLSEFVNPEKFKSFEEQAKRFKDVTGKPYNWLSEEAVEDEVKAIQTQKELDDIETEDSRDDIEDSNMEHIDDTLNDEGDDSDASDDIPEGETAIERFRRLANKSK